MQWHNFHYLTEDREELLHVELAAQACTAGARWIQFRSKQKNQEELRNSAAAVLQVCRRFGSVCIFNDHVELARDLSADGVHLGQNDMAIGTARRILGDGAIIGGTANTTEEVEALMDQDVSYIGIGPYRHTTTKKVLSPILGIAGVSKLVDIVQGRVPVVAVGGILPSDLSALYAAGVSGVAVSRAAHCISSPTGIEKFLRFMHQEAGDVANC